MRGFPKRISTEADFLNCLAMVQQGDLLAEDLTREIAAVEQREYVSMPIVEISDDRKTVVVADNELIVAGKKIRNNSSTSISAVVEVDEAAFDEDGVSEEGSALRRSARTLLTGDAETVDSEEPESGDSDAGIQEETKLVSVTLTRAIPEDSKILQVVSPVNPYDAIGTTKEKLMAMKEVLSSL